VAGAFVLSTLGFDLCWTRIGLGDFPLVLQLQQHGMTFVERDRLLDEERVRLRERGLWAATEPAPNVRAALRILAAPDLELDLRIGGGVPTVRALAAARGATAVLAVHRHGLDEVELSAVHPDALGAAVLGIIGAPDVIGRGSVAVLAEALDELFAETGTSERSGAEVVLSAGFRRLGCNTEDAAAVGKGLALPLGVAQIGMAYGSGPSRHRARRYWPSSTQPRAATCWSPSPTPTASVGPRCSRRRNAQPAALSPSCCPRHNHARSPG